MLLYLHIPFCDSKCYYCSFNSYTTKHSFIDKYMKTICKQFEYESKDLKKSQIKTLYIGGGTPSCVSAEKYEVFFEKAAFYLKDDAEITIEANPNSASKEWLQKMREYGVNRISIGVQSFFEDKLKLLGRNHTPKRAKEAVLEAKKVGFEHISIDLIYSTSLDDKKRLQKELQEAFSLPVDHISAYSLTIEENTPFAKRDDVQKDDENLALFFAQEIKKRGFFHYEISNFGRCKSKHNLGYWSYEDYIGIGAGAVGCKERVRYYPPSDIQTYIDNPLSYKTERLLDKDIKLEKIFLGFRCELGVDKDIFDEKEMIRIKELVKEKKLTLKGKKVYNKDFFLTDELVMYIGV